MFAAPAFVELLPDLSIKLHKTLARAHFGLVVVQVQVEVFLRKIGWHQREKIARVNEKMTEDGQKKDESFARSFFKFSPCTPSGR